MAHRMSFVACSKDLRFLQIEGEEQPQPLVGGALSVREGGLVVGPQVVEDRRRGAAKAFRIVSLSPGDAWGLDHEQACGQPNGGGNCPRRRDMAALLS